MIFNKIHKTKKKDGIRLFSLPETGLEPARPCEHWSLKPARLPIPPLGHLRCKNTTIFLYGKDFF